MLGLKSEGQFGIIWGGECDISQLLVSHLGVHLIRIQRVKQTRILVSFRVTEMKTVTSDMFESEMTFRCKMSQSLAGGDAAVS